MDERLKTLKPGGSVTVRNGDFISSQTVLAVLEHGVLIAHDKRGPFNPTFFASLDDIVWPLAPKAKPGVVYRDRDRFYRIGTIDGRLWAEHDSVIDFTPDWQEVPEP